MAGSYAVSPQRPNVIDTGLLLQEQRKCTVDHRKARQKVMHCMIKQLRTPYAPPSSVIHN